MAKLILYLCGNVRSGCNGRRHQSKIKPRGKKIWAQITSACACPGHLDFDRSEVNGDAQAPPPPALLDLAAPRQAWGRRARASGGSRAAGPGRSPLGRDPPVRAAVAAGPCGSWYRGGRARGTRVALRHPRPADLRREPGRASVRLLLRPAERAVLQPAGPRRPQDHRRPDRPGHTIRGATPRHRPGELGSQRVRPPTARGGGRHDRPDGLPLAGGLRARSGRRVAERADTGRAHRVASLPRAAAPGAARDQRATVVPGVRGGGRSPTRPPRG